MSSLQARFDALQQQHELTVIELTDVREDYERIKKLNTTILENMMKEQPSEMLSEIKVMIGGGSYADKISELEREVEVLRAGVQAEVQRRLQELMKGIQTQTAAQHDCDNCHKCIKYRKDCPSCSRHEQKLRNYEKIVTQKSQRYEKLQLELDRTRGESSTVQMRMQQEASQKINELEQINRMLSASLQQHEAHTEIHQQKLEQLNEEWQQQYNRLAEDYNAIVQELSQYKQMQQQQQWHEETGRKRNMMKEIQNIMGELGSRKESGQQKMSKMSRVSGGDSDLSAFSIKDAINRPSKFTFY